MSTLGRASFTSRADQQRAGLIDAGQAGALLGVPKTWVLAEARADRIPHVRLGRYVRFEAPELQAWWQIRRRGPQMDRQHEAA